MITEIAIVAGVAGVGLTIADQQNLFGTNPEKKWFWERPPFAPAIPPPAARARMQNSFGGTMPQSMVAPQRLNPRQELAKAEALETQARYAVARVKAQYPGLSNAKYQVTA